MIRRYCDLCGNEIEEGEAFDGGKHRNANNRLATTVQGPSGHKMQLEVTTGLDGCWNRGDFCKSCILDALLKLRNAGQAPSPGPGGIVLIPGTEGASLTGGPTDAITRNT